MNTRSLIPIDSLIEDVIPSEWLDPTEDVLQKVALDLGESTTMWTPYGVYMRHRILILKEVGIEFPLIPGARITLGDESRLLTFLFTFRTTPFVELIIDELGITLWLPKSVVKPYTKESGVWEEVRSSSDGSVSDFPLTCRAGLRADLEGNLDIPFPSDTLMEISIPHAGMIADTGFILDFNPDERSGDDGGGIRFVFVTLPKEIVDLVPLGFRGLYIPRLAIEYHNPDNPDTKLPTLTITNAAIGSGGFSGKVGFGIREPARELIDRAITEANRRGGVIEVEQLHLVEGDTNGDFYLIQLLGMKAILHYLSFSFAQSVPEASSLIGYVFLPFIDDWMEFNISLGGPDADFMLDIGGVGDQALISLENDWLEIKADSITYLTKDGVHYVVISGSVRPKFLSDEIDWPEFKVEKLLISSEGDIELEGGWIDLPEAKTLDFYGFKITISEVGFGNEEITDDAGDLVKYQWLGLSGEITLIEGVPLSASVEGLKFSWNPNNHPPSGELDVTLNGIGVEMEIPGTLQLEGAVSYNDEEKLFKGNVNVDLQALNTEIDGQLIIGRQTDLTTGEDYTAFYIVLDVQLSSAIPLANSGTGIYGLTGLFGLNIAPDREEESWYEWYKTQKGSDPESQYNVSTLEKWMAKYDHFAFGAGITLGTQFDDGYSLNIKALVAVLIPGPVVMIEGTANVLKTRHDSNKSAAFYALVVFDGNAGTLQVNVDAKYNLQRIVDIHGGLEAFFDFKRRGNWHIYLGQKDPESKRIQAEIVEIFTAQAYFMISNDGLQVGAMSGLNLEKDFGPVSITFIMRLAFDAGIFWKPLQMLGSIELYGELALKVFGIGFGIMLRLLLEGKAPAPYWVHGLAEIALSLCWPLPDLSVQVEFTWEENAEPTPVDDFLKSVVFTHHKLKSASWQLNSPDSPPSDESAWHVISVDSSPLLNFARPISGLSAIVNVEPDQVDNFEFSYYLDDVSLEVYMDDTDSWQTVRQGFDDSTHAFNISADNFIPDTGAQEPGLKLWRYHALDGSTQQTRESCAVERDPCRRSVEAMKHCVNWQGVPNGYRYDSEFRYQNLLFIARIPDGENVGPVVEEHQLKVRVLAKLVEESELKRHLIIHFPEPVRWVELSLDTESQPYRYFIKPWLHRVSLDVDAEVTLRHGYAVFFFGRELDVLEIICTPDFFVAKPPEDIYEVKVVSICYKTSRELNRYAAVGHVRFEDELFSSNPELMLEPDKKYRLTVNTRFESHPNLKDSPTYEPKTYYFRTDRGPGTAPNIDKAKHKDTPVNELASYISRTSPTNGARNHYYGYDIGLEFNELYVPYMYGSEPLRFRIKDRNGRIVGNNAGVWGEGAALFVNDGALTALKARHDGGCLPEMLPPTAKVPLLSGTAPAELSPNKLYNVEVFIESHDDPLYTFQFTTSKFRNFEVHMTSGKDKDGYQIVRTFPAIPADFSLDMDLLSGVAEHLNQTRRAQKNLNDAISFNDSITFVEELDYALGAASAFEEGSAERFDDLYGRLGETVPRIPNQPRFDLRPLPERVELVRIPIGDPTKNILLLESPEPIEWRRILFSCNADGSKVNLQILCNADQTRAFLFADSAGWFSNGEYRLNFHYRGDYPDLPPLKSENSFINSWARLYVNLV
jgi:hypothetical protein